MLIEQKNIQMFISEAIFLNNINGIISCNNRIKRMYKTHSFYFFKAFHSWDNKIRNIKLVQTYSLVICFERKNNILLLDICILVVTVFEICLSYLKLKTHNWYWTTILQLWSHVPSRLFYQLFNNIQWHFLE